jgi:hypothetical protein
MATLQFRKLLQLCASSIMFQEFVNGIAEELGLKKLSEHSNKGLITYENVEITIGFQFDYESESDEADAVIRKALGPGTWRIKSALRQVWRSFLALFWRNC